MATSLLTDLISKNFPFVVRTLIVFEFFAPIVVFLDVLLSCETIAFAITLKTTTMTMKLDVDRPMTMQCVVRNAHASSAFGHIIIIIEHLATTMNVRQHE
jgi:hypothetical protein